MTTRNCKSGNPPIPEKPHKAIRRRTVKWERFNLKRPKPAPSLAKQIILTIDELHDVLALNYFFYDAVEAMTYRAKSGLIFSDNYDGLMLWTRYLRERDQGLRDQCGAMYRMARAS